MFSPYIYFFLKPHWSKCWCVLLTPTPQPMKLKEIINLRGINIYRFLIL